MNRALLTLGVFAGQNREHRPADDPGLELGAGIQADDGGAVMDGVEQRLIGIQRARKRHGNTWRRRKRPPLLLLARMRSDQNSAARAARESARSSSIHWRTNSTSRSATNSDEHR